MKKTNKVATLAATLITLGSLAGRANAARIFAYYDTTVSFSEYAEASAGDPLKYVVALDNGGSSITSQTWLPADLMSVTFYANNGAINIEFDSQPPRISESFTSDASGNLTIVAQFGALNSVNASNITASDYAFYIDTGNPVLFTNNSRQNIGQNNPANNRIASNWTLSTTNPIPEPSSTALLGLGTITLITLRRR